jgi:DNA modification methylase
MLSKKTVKKIDHLIMTPQQLEMAGISEIKNEHNLSNEIDMSQVDKVYDKSEEQELVPQIVDPRNTLNDLTGKEWLPETKSFFFQKGLGAKHPHAQIERLHPAPYSFQDIARLINFFTKKGNFVLDPFGGIGSTAKACALYGRICTSIELSREWHELSIKRLEVEVSEGESLKHFFINADCIPMLKTFEDGTFDFMVTSPPYWAILNKKADHKVKKGRVEQNLATNYSSNDRDLGNVKKYEDFLDILVSDVFTECGRVLKEKKYMCIVVSDFRNKSEFISFHSDLIQRLSHVDLGGNCELTLQGVKILAQNHKSLLPYGYPFAYVENIHHQYILIFRKTKNRVSEK